MACKGIQRRVEAIIEESHEADVTKMNPLTYTAHALGQKVGCKTRLGNRPAELPCQCYVMTGKRENANITNSVQLTTWSPPAKKMKAPKDFNPEKEARLRTLREKERRLAEEVRKRFGRGESDEGGDQPPQEPLHGEDEGEEVTER